MITFFAGAEAAQHRNTLWVNGVRNVLVSYWQLRNRNDVSDFAKFNLFLDSGGFSARSRGVEIDIKDYGNFVKKYPMFKHYANLDMLDTAKTLYHQQTLEAMGLNPIPVYHFDEWNKGMHDLFKEYISKYPYIALGGVAGANCPPGMLNNYLDYCFRETKGKTKFHGFGMTKPDLVLRYPFYSIDSTTWLSGGKFNSVLKFKDGDLKTTKIYKALNYTERDEINIKEILKFEKFVNDLWKRRGISWN